MTQAPIEGEFSPVPDEESASGRALARRQDTAAAVFNPLDAEPVAFKQQLANRQENYDALAMHLRGVLVLDKDFGRIHVAPKSKCPEPWHCSPERAPGHWSDYEIFASGADKILGILGLGVHYPGLQDYKRAVLKGYHIEEVIADAQILSQRDQVIAEGAGACSRSEVKDSLNNCIKKACKRARVDAVKRLPVVSALFEADFLAEVAAQQAQARTPSVAARQQKVRKRWDTGAKLDVCPIGRTQKGKPWREIPTEHLEWMVANVTDKPDIYRAATEELSKRGIASGSGSIRTPAPPASPSDERQHSQTEEDYFNDDLNF